LLAAYNGGEYGPELLDSLLKQTHGDFRLLVRDDGSSDQTPAVLLDYARKFQGRMEILPAGAPTGSAKGNFSILLEASTADYVLCADIDDVWFPNKVGDTLELLARAEARHSSSVPIMVYSDLAPVNAQLEPLNESYWRFKKTDPKVGLHLSQSLVCPVVLGCASGMNRALVDMVTPVPEAVTGHDWWAHLVALAFGAVHYSTDPTVFYRLHGNNLSTPREVKLSNYVTKKNKIGIVRRGMQRRFEQAQALIDRFGDGLRPEPRRIVENFVAIASQSFVERRISLIRGNYLYPDLPRNLAMLVGT
jgi:glycosyltransferase involved in cell wall biosynthesis